MRRAIVKVRIGLLLVASAAVCCPAAAAPADEPTDNAILGGAVADICSATDRTATMACSAYLRGMADGLLAAEYSASDDDQVSFCPPSDGIGSNEIKQIFLSFVREDPDLRTEDAGTLLLSALEDHYPCDDSGLSDGAVDQVAFHHRMRSRHGRSPARPVTKVTTR